MRLDALPGGTWALADTATARPWHSSRNIPRACEMGDTVVRRTPAIEGFPEECSRQLATRRHSGLLHIRLRGGRKRKRTTLPEGDQSIRPEKLLARSKDSSGSAQKDTENPRSRFAHLLVPNEEQKDPNVSEDQSEEGSSSAVTCPACNEVHLRTDNQTTDSATDSEDMSNTSSLLYGHALDAVTRAHFESLPKDSNLDPQAYDMLFQKCIERESLDQSLALYEVLKNQSLTPTFESLDCILHLCEAEGRWDVGLAVLHDVRASGLTLNEDIYGKVIKVCSDIEEWELVVSLFDEMKASNLKQDSECFSHALQAMKQLGDSDRAVTEFVRLKKQSEPSQDQYDSVIGVLLETNRLNEARALMKENNEMNARLAKEEGADEHLEEESSNHVISVEQARRELGAPEVSSDADAVAGTQKEDEPRVIVPDSEGSGGVDSSGGELEDESDYE